MNQMQSTVLLKWLFFKIIVEDSQPINHEVLVALIFVIGAFGGIVEGKQLGLASVFFYLFFILGIWITIEVQFFTCVVILYELQFV